MREERRQRAVDKVDKAKRGIEALKRAREAETDAEKQKREAQGLLTEYQQHLVVSRPTEFSFGFDGPLGSMAMRKLEAALSAAEESLRGAGGDTSQDKSTGFIDFSKDALGPFGFLATSYPRLRLTRDHTMEGRHAVLDEPAAKDPGKRTLPAANSAPRDCLI